MTKAEAKRDDDQSNLELALSDVRSAHVSFQSDVYKHV